MKFFPKRNILLKILGGIAAILLIVLTGLTIIPTDWIVSKIGGKGSALTGRELVIDGPVQIDWNWHTPSVHIEKIRMSNVEGSKDPQMVSIDALDFKIQIWKLLLLRLDIPELKITKPKIVLEKDSEGNKNWDLPAFSKGNAAANAALPDSRSNFPIIGTMDISDGTLIYRDETKKLDLNLSIDTIKGSPSDSNDMFALSGDGKLQDQKFTISMTGGSLQALRDSSKDYPLHLDVGMGPTRVKIDGTFKDPVKMEGISAVLDLKGDNLADLFYLTSIPLPPTPPYSLTGTLKKEGGIWNFNDFKGKVGDSDLSGNLQYDTSSDRGIVTADLVSELLDIDDLGGFIGVAPSVKKGETASTEQKQQAAKQKASDRALPDVPLDLDRLRTTNMKVTLKVNKIHAPGTPLENMNVKFDLQDGVLKLDPMDLGVAGGIVDGAMMLDGSKDVPDVNMDLALKKLRLKPFFSDSRFESFSSGTFGGKIKLAGSGKSLAEVLGVSNGHVTVSMSGGEISLLIVEAAGLDIGEATPLLFGKDKNTHIRCVVGDFDVKDGLLKSNAFVFDTTDSNIQGDANINLKNENLDISVEAHPKDKSILTLRTPITVTGTMKHPSIGINPSGLAGRGAGAAVLGVIFPPLAVIPFIELGLGEDSDCRDLIAQSKANSANSHPTP